jgi:hypothetical protein
MFDETYASKRPANEERSQKLALRKVPKDGTETNLGL